MNLFNYAGFLDAARAQPETQRLLFVFAEASLPGQPSSRQRARFDGGQGGTLTPVMCLDRLPSELGGFDELLDESRRTGQPWDIMFAASLAGRQGAAPDSGEAERALRLMIDSIQRGALERFLAFDRTGETVRFF